ncbi:MAG: 23S rRNA (uracil(1939)-C(5))-methyltransferase RlmD [Clostridia bacterium]|nr:23S rRNA (uracil(1939)-C(5))-methyltransferase RlmD [Clostridia bacterium]
MKNQNLKKDDTVTVRINEINNLGSGVGKLEGGCVIFINGAVTGELVRAKLIKVNKSFCVGKLEEILEPSPYRENSFCHAPLSCGGCVYRHVKREHELELKKSYVEHSFIKVGLSDIKVNDVLHLPERSGYRNKAQYPIGIGKNGVTAGFYAAKTHKIIPCLDCALQPAIFGEILSFFCEFATKKGISVYNEESGSGLLRHLYLRYGKSTDEIMVCIVINGDSMPHSDELCTSLTEKIPSVKSIMLNINTKNTNVVLGEKYITLFGKSYITDVLCGKKFNISPGSFYQVNHDTAELLYKTAADLGDFSGNETVLDLYCGIGTIGLSMADKVGKIIGIEIVPEAVECAKENARINEIENAEFYCGDASSAEKLFENASKAHGELKPDAVIIDPPRKGSTPELINYLARIDVPKIIYISCDPDTLARDCVLFRELGYTIGDVTPVDMFPATGHIESVVCLSREKADDYIHISVQTKDLKREEIVCHEVNEDEK